MAGCDRCRGGRRPALQLSNNLLQCIGARPTTAIVDLGYRLVDKDMTPVEAIHRDKFMLPTPQQKSRLKRRQPIEPVIVHTKSDDRMGQCWLEGGDEDALQAVLCAAG